MKTNAVVLAVTTREFEEVWEASVAVQTYVASLLTKLLQNRALIRTRHKSSVSCKPSRLDIRFFDNKLSPALLQRLVVHLCIDAVAWYVDLDNIAFLDQCDLSALSRFGRYVSYRRTP